MAVAGAEPAPRAGAEQEFVSRGRNSGRETCTEPDQGGCSPRLDAGFVDRLYCRPKIRVLYSRQLPENSRSRVCKMPTPAISGTRGTCQTPSPRTLFDVCRRKGKTRLPVDGRFPDDTGRHRAVSGGSAHEHPFDTVAGVDTQPQARDGRGPGGALAPVILPKPAHTAPGRASKNSPIRVGHGHRGRADTKRVRVTTKMRSGAASAVPYPVPPFFAKAIMHPQPSPHGMTHHPQQLSTPGAVWGMAAMLWCTAGILFTEFAVNMITAPLYGVEL